MLSREYRDKFRNTCLNHYKNQFNGAEIWAFHPKYENILVSSLGKVKNCDTNHEYATRVNDQGYVNVSIIPKGRGRSLSCLIHRLVAETFFAFIGLEAFEVNHINGNKADNSVYNVEWLTREENLQHARDTGLFKQQFGQVNGRFKYSEQDIKDIEEFNSLGFSYVEISKAYGLSGSGIYKALKRRTGCPKYK